MFFPRLGEQNHVIQIEETHLPVKTGKNVIHEVREGRGGVANFKRYLVELEQLAAACPEHRLGFIRFADGHLPVTALEIERGEPSGVVEAV